MAEPTPGLGGIRVAVLTVSTSRAEGSGEGDAGGDALAACAEELGGQVIVRELISDERSVIVATLREACDVQRCELVLTTGGTGLAPDDVTPEATREVAERLAPGLAEAMRLASRESTPMWMLSRGVAATRGSSLILNFPGSRKAIPECWNAISGALPHALRLLAGTERSHAADSDRLR